MLFLLFSSRLGSCVNIWEPHLENACFASYVACASLDESASSRWGLWCRGWGGGGISLLIISGGSEYILAPSTTIPKKLFLRSPYLVVNEKQAYVSSEQVAQLRNQTIFGKKRKCLGKYDWRLNPVISPVMVLFHFKQPPVGRNICFCCPEKNVCLL